MMLKLLLPVSWIVTKYLITFSWIKFTYKELPNIISMITADIKLNSQAKTESSSYQEIRDGLVKP